MYAIHDNCVDNLTLQYSWNHMLLASRHEYIRRSLYMVIAQTLVTNGEWKCVCVYLCVCACMCMCVCVCVCV